MAITISNAGYIKRLAVSSYRKQKRGGKGVNAMTTRDEDFVSQVFIANTHAPVLFFSSKGKVYRLKVYRLPQGAPQARGKAMVNLFPLEQDETIHTVLPLPADEASWAGRYVMFATASGYVRRNDLADFRRVASNGKIAMKLNDDDRIIGVSLCGERDDVLLAAREGKCIRFPVIDVRVFKGRDSVGVRGIRLGRDDRVVSMSVLRHTEFAAEQRERYVRWANGQRRGEEGVAAPENAEAMAEQEQFILSVTQNGYGKRTSAYEYRTAGRGGKGIINIETSTRNGPVVTSAPVEESEQIMLVTDSGRMIRTAVAGISFAGRSTQGVTLFDVEEDERVVSTALLADTDDGEDNGDDDGGDEGGDEGENAVAE
jgi:DNA gyrase subunit A